MRSKSLRKILLFELNEFNLQLLQSVAKDFSLKNIQRLLALKQAHTHTHDTYESDYLEPWVQWVSVHTGCPSQKHCIKHLGDVPHLDTPQIWERLSENGVTSGVWGAMNSSRNGASGCLFFVPDPWTFSERAYPKELNGLLDLPRYLSKNYLNISKIEVIRKLLRLIKIIYSGRAGLAFISELPSFLLNVIRFRGEHFVFISFTEYISSLLFLEYRRRLMPDFSLLFVNTIAHLQHHHWVKDDSKNNKRLAYGMRFIDKLLGKIFKTLKENESLIVMNALSQVNTNKERPWILYRQFDQKNFLLKAGVKFSRIEPHMTHDAHIFFERAEECRCAEHILKNATINECVLFLVESYSTNPTKLFYRINFTDEVNQSAILKINGRTFRFFDLFEAIVVRTGKHIPHGTIFSDLPELPEVLKNHELCDHILKVYDGLSEKLSIRNNRETFGHDLVEPA